METRMKIMSHKNINKPIRLPDGSIDDNILSTSDLTCSDFNVEIADVNKMISVLIFLMIG